MPGVWFSAVTFMCMNWEASLFWTRSASPVHTSVKLEFNMALSAFLPSCFQNQTIYYEKKNTLTQQDIEILSS